MAALMIEGTDGAAVRQSRDRIRTNRHTLCVDVAKPPSPPPPFALAQPPELCH